MHKEKRKKQKILEATAKKCNKNSEVPKFLRKLSSKV
jgi:hypothetical protein